MANYSDKLNITGERVDEIRAEVLRSILDFIVKELASVRLDPDQKESLQVAKQCLEACYELEDTNVQNATDLVELFHQHQIPQNLENASELEAEAEQFKNKGNEAMKDNNYPDAVENYSKAIKIYNKKAIYYCNRAAAYSRMDRNNEAIQDCKDAIKLDPNYGKAYGRLGIAYSNLNKYKEAAEAYRRAIQLDPSNPTYETNLKLAEEKMQQYATGDAQGFDFGGFMNNPALLNMASQMLNDPSFRNMVSGIMSSGSGADPTLESFVEVGQQLASHLQASNPGVLENIRQSLINPRNPSGNPSANPSDNNGSGDADKPPEPKNN